MTDLRTEQKAERRERILESAREMIGKRGYESLTMRDLAHAARVTVPTIYNLIGGKEVVLFAAIEEQTARFVSAFASDANASAASRVLTVVDSCTREILRMPRYYRSLLGILLQSEMAHQIRDHVDRVLIGEFETALAQMRDAGELAEWADPFTLARSLTVQLEFTSMGWAGGEVESERLEDAAVYGVGLMLLGAATGASRRELVARVQRAQSRIAEHRAGKDPATEKADAQA